MDDLIKRSDVLNVLKKASFGGTITEAVESIPAVPDVNRWISVDERFPTESESKEYYILCFCRAGITCLLEWNGEYWFDADDNQYYSSGFVTHWMLIIPPEC